MKTIKVDDQLVAAFLDGNTSLEETAAIMSLAEKDKDFAEMLDLLIPGEDDAMGVYPCGAVAAVTNDNGNRCAVLCEQYLLGRFGVERSIEDLERRAYDENWLTEDGMPFENMGCLLESEGLTVKRTFHNSIEDIRRALSEGRGVIVMVDAGEIWGESNDIENGFTPNHAIVIAEVGAEDVVFFDPESAELKNISIECLTEAWNDSSQYMVTCAGK